MKISACCIVPLLFVMLSARKERSSSEESLRALHEFDDLAGSIKNLFGMPEPAACETQAKQWSADKKQKVAKSVFNTLRMLFVHPSEFTLDKLLVARKCRGSGEHLAILHMKVKKTVDSTPKCFNFLCSSNKPKNVYCSWIGTHKDEDHEKMIGAVCYYSRTISAKEEKEFEKLDICQEWKYALPLSNTQTGGNMEYGFPRILPASTGPHMYLLVAAKVGEKAARKYYLNPEGRTGIAGQGIFQRLGENKMDMPIILRYYKGMRQILLVAHREKDSTDGPLAFFYRKPKKSSDLRDWKGPSADEYFYSLVKSHKKENCSMDKISTLMEPTRKIFDGHFPHPDETDNAWINAIIYPVFVDEEPCLYDLDLASKANYLNFQWRTYNDSTLRSVQSMVNNLFTKKQSRKITVQSYRTAAHYLFYLVTAAALVAMGLGPVGTSMIFLAAIPAAIIILAAILFEIYIRRWIFIRETIIVCKSDQ